jgi:hypothetical protein
LHLAEVKIGIRVFYVANAMIIIFWPVGKKIIAAPTLEVCQLLEKVLPLLRKKSKITPSVA